MTKTVKIAYIGGGSRGWARILIHDLALHPELNGEVFLYDTNYKAAQLNADYGKWIQGHPDNKAKWKYTAAKNPDTALRGADFVLMALLPGSFDEMEADIAIPAKYGIYHSVGDTVGPAGLVRSLRSVPIFKFYAHKIMQFCPKAWVINFTNPMAV
ncbi:MAG: alpha-glucosidase/alpha-galactosidase, partial [bacterium]